MKTLALIIIFTAQATGIWPQLPSTARDTLTNAAATATKSQVAMTAPAPPVLPARALPLRTGAAPLDLATSSAVAVDGATGTVLYAKNAGATRPIASITKLVTAMVVLSRHAASDTITVPTLPAYEPDAERVGLLAGETYSVKELIQALLINSGNDAADALALHDAGSLTKFAARMNAKMGEWGVGDAHFAGPSGLQETGNYASANAIARIAALALAHPLIKATVAQTSATITSTSGRTIALTTTNKLLDSGQFYGIKTGYTLAAGECFVGLTRINGHEVITVVLGSGNRFGVTQTLRTWIEQNYQWL